MVYQQLKGIHRIYYYMLQAEPTPKQKKRKSGCNTMINLNNKLTIISFIKLKRNEVQLTKIIVFFNLIRTRMSILSLELAILMNYENI